VSIQGGRSRSGYGLGHSSDARHQQVGDEAVGRVAGIWQGLVGAELSASRRQRFRAHPDLAALCCYDGDQLLAAGAELYRRTGQLLLADWVRECAWAGGGTVSLDWAELAAGDPDATIAGRDLLAAAVASVLAERDRVVMVQRLGLDGDAAMTLQAIGESLGRTRERARQLQEKALDDMCSPHVPPRAGRYAGQVIAAVLGQAADADAGTEPAVSLLTLAEAILPGVAPGLAVRVLARLAGHNHNTSRHLAAEATTILAAGRAELAREARDARSAERTAERLARMLPYAEWPGGRSPAPPRSVITPQREPQDNDGAGRWLSPKLAREVSYDSRSELSLIRVLDRAPQIIWFCEQPVAIGYSFAGRHRTYLPRHAGGHRRRLLRTH
jgi:Sigma-70, region 4